MVTRRQARRAVGLHEDELSAYPNVVGLGILAEEEKGEKEYRVAVYVSRKVAPAKLAPNERIPTTVEIPARRGTHKVKTRVVESGEVETEEFKAESL